MISTPKQAEKTQKISRDMHARQVNGKSRTQECVVRMRSGQTKRKPDRQML